MRFVDSLWQEIGAIHGAIIAHPFNRELAEGVLSRERFEFYIQQDALYLADFGRALAIMAGRSHTAERALDFVRFAEGAVVVERALHASYFELFGIREPTTVQCPACFAYTNYLIATAATRSYEEGAAALLPCFWIYREVGRHIHREAVPDNPYQKWIDTYASDDFDRIVERAIGIVEALAQETSELARRRMREAFVTSSRLEWMFWDAAYRLEAWQP
ncbi:MAG: thiaminase II [Anaerolineae bacterium]|nr:thiaminase II [Anaerolineae bacterium]